MALKKQKPKAIIVGGSMAGVSCAKALILAGWDVVVLEKSRGPPTGSPTGAGLGLDTLAQKIIQSWLTQPALLHEVTLPLTVDQAKVVQTDEIIEIVGDLLVAADGSRSSVRQSLLPDVKLRYSGYCAWRGVVDFSGCENSETVVNIRKMYPDLGNCLYMDLGYRTHSTLTELMYKRLNWIWFVNQPEPELKGNSVTIKVSNDMIRTMHQEADKVWLPELAILIKATKDPFINVIYDCDPLERIVWHRVVLIGDAAHPTTPHCGRSTNMSILDAAVLGKCLCKWEPENLQSALEEYQSVRLPVTSKQVLHSRLVGRIKQGLSLPSSAPFDPKKAKNSEDYLQDLRQINTPHFFDVPSILDSMFCYT